MPALPVSSVFGSMSPGIVMLPMPVFSVSEPAPSPDREPAGMSTVNVATPGMDGMVMVGLPLPS